MMAAVAASLKERNDVAVVADRLVVGTSRPGGEAEQGNQERSLAKQLMTAVHLR
jgi:hypothetical protein